MLRIFVYQIENFYTRMELPGLKMKPFLILAALLFIGSGCRHVPPANDKYVSSIINTRIDKEIYWHAVHPEDEQLKNAIQDMLSQELSIDTAVQIALLNNPQIQETFEKIGIAQADLIEAGLFSNPVFGAFFRYPNKSGLPTNTEISVTQSFIDLFLVPLKTKVAAGEVERVKCEVAYTILELSFEVEKTYYSLIAAQKKKTLLKNIIELAEIANEISLSQRKIANINSLEFHLRTADYLARVTELADTEADIVYHREEFNKLLGLKRFDIRWSVPQELPPIQDSEPSFDCIENIALNERLDIQAAKWEIENIKRKFPTVEWWTFTDLQVGASTTREPEPNGPWSTGPAITGQIPIFNFGQGARTRVTAEFRQAQATLNALENEVTAQVRKARDIVFVFRNQALVYKERVLPNQALVVQSTEELYNIMGTGIFDLLDTKRHEISAFLDYQMALKEYWISKVNLNKSIGGKLSMFSFYTNQCCDGSET